MYSKVYPKSVAMNDVSYWGTPKAAYANWRLKNHGASACIPARQQKTLEMQSTGNQAWNPSPGEKNCILQLISGRSRLLL